MQKCSPGAQLDHSHPTLTNLTGLELASPHHSLWLRISTTLPQPEGTPSSWKKNPFPTPGKEVRWYRITSMS